MIPTFQKILSICVVLVYIFFKTLSLNKCSDPSILSIRLWILFSIAPRLFNWEVTAQDSLLYRRWQSTQKYNCMILPFKCIVNNSFGLYCQLGNKENLNSSQMIRFPIEHHYSNTETNDWLCFAWEDIMKFNDKHVYKEKKV